MIANNEKKLKRFLSFLLTLTIFALTATVIVGGLVVSCLVKTKKQVNSIENRMNEVENKVEEIDNTSNKRNTIYLIPKDEEADAWRD